MKTITTHKRKSKKKMWERVSREPLSRVSAGSSFWLDGNLNADIFRSCPGSKLLIKQFCHRWIWPCSCGDLILFLLIIKFNILQISRPGNALGCR